MFTPFEKNKRFFSRTEKIEDSTLTSQKSGIKAVLFDVFGTVVDWRGTLVKAFSEIFNEKGFHAIDCEEFVEQLSNAYSDNMTKTSEGKQAFVTVDDLNRIALDTLLKEYNIFHRVTEDERDQMWMFWRQLKPWPDSVPGINKLKKHFKTGTLSNGNIKLLEDLSRNAKIVWDIILSGEIFRCYKPDPLVYKSAAQALELDPSEILLIASHKYDLEAARKCGWKTAYIYRPLECRTIDPDQKPIDDEFDFVTESIDDLAEKLGELVLELSARKHPN